jgi:hypothetical protein
MQPVFDAYGVKEARSLRANPSQRRGTMHGIAEQSVRIGGHCSRKPAAPMRL